MILNDDDKLTLGKKITVLAQYADEHDERGRNGKASGFVSIEESAQASRRPRGDTPIGMLLSKPFTFTQPPGTLYCSGKCADFRPISYFAHNPAHKRGYDYECKQCKNERDRERRLLAALQEGRELRAYRRRAA